MGPCPSREASEGARLAPVETASKTKTGLDDGNDGYWSMAWEFALEHRAVFASSFFDSFDWFAYAYMQPQIALAIFGGNDSVAWLVWATPFLTCTIGSSIFRALEKAYGGQTSVIAASCTLVVGTVGQALTPLVPIVAPAWITTFRVIQGIGYGGKYAAGNVFLAETAPTRILAMSRVVLLLPVSAGFVTLSCIALPLYACLTPQQLLRWGWRVPFVVATLALFPLFLLNLPEKDVEEEEEEGLDSEGAGSDVSRVSDWTNGFDRVTWQPGLLLMGGMALDCAFDGLGGAFLKAWLRKFCAFSDFKTTLLVLCAELVFAPALIGSLYLCDTYGLGTTCVSIAAAGVACGAPIFLLPYWFPGNAFLVYGSAVLLYGCVNGTRGCFVAWCTDLFPEETRATAVGCYGSLIYLSVGAGPILCTSRQFAAPMYCLVSSLITLFTLVYAVQSNYYHRQGKPKGWIKVDYLRPNPY